MNVRSDVNFEELARSTDDFNGAQLKAVCVEAGMLALRRDATEVSYSRNSFVFCQSSYVLSILLLEAYLRVFCIHRLMATKSPALYGLCSVYT